MEQFLSWWQKQLLIYGSSGFVAVTWLCDSVSFEANGFLIFEEEVLIRWCGFWNYSF
jgi:hypothetical protein